MKTRIHDCLGFALFVVLFPLAVLAHAEKADKSLQATERPESRPKIDAEVPPPLPKLRLAGDAVTANAIERLAGGDWGSVTLADAHLNGVIVNGLRHASTIRTLRLFGTGLSGQVSRLAAVPGLIELEIGAPLNSRDLEAIGRLTHLERLSLPQGLTLNVADAREIARLVRLKSLRLYNVNIDDASFAELRTLVRLHELDLTHTRITDEGLAMIADLPLLRTLELHRHPKWHTSQQLTGASLASINRLPQLERLSLSGEITNAGLHEIARCSNLKSLSILNTEITCDGLAALEHSSVERLTVTTGQVDERALQHLKKCRSLKSVCVVGEPVGDMFERFQMLQHRVPNIDWSFSS